MIKQEIQSNQSYFDQGDISNFYTNNTKQQKLTNFKNPGPITYTFPVKLLQYQTLQNQQQYKALLKKQAEQIEEVHKSQGWQTQRRKGKKQQLLSFRCRKCKVVIVYQLNKDKSMKLLRFNNHHIHPIENNKAFKILSGLAIYQNAHLGNKKLHNKIKLSYPMAKYRFLKSKKKSLIEHSNFDLIKQLLTFNGYTYKYEHSDSDSFKQGYPETIIAVTPQHKENYKNYGQCINYDIIYNCVHQKSFTGKKYGVGIFTGFDHNNRILVFGLSIATYENVSDYKKVFICFFDLMGVNNTTAIITTNEKKLVSALQQLKLQQNYKFHHIYESLHFLKSFKYFLKGKLDDRSRSYLIKKLNKSMKETDPILGKKTFNQINDILVLNQLKLQSDRLKNKIQHICIWAMPTVFIGLSLQSNQTINELLRMQVQQQTSLYELIQKFEKVSNQRHSNSENKSNYETYCFQVFFDDKKINEVRTKFEKKVFNYFIQNYQKCLFYQTLEKQQIDQNQSQQFLIMHILNQQQKYLIKDLECTCKATYKTGIPCEHLIYVHKKYYTDDSYVNLFNPRWIPKSRKKVHIRQTNQSKRIKQEEQQ